MQNNAILIARVIFYTCQYSRAAAGDRKAWRNLTGTCQILLLAAETANRASALSFPLADLNAHVRNHFSVVCHLPVYSQGVAASSNNLASLVRLRRSVKQP
jgi:hypothetical protein